MMTIRTRTNLIMALKLDEQAQIYSLLKETGFELLGSNSDEELLFRKIEHNEVIEVIILCDVLAVKTRLIERLNPRNQAEKAVPVGSSQEIQEFVQSGLEETRAALRLQLAGHSAGGKPGPEI